MAALFTWCDVTMGTNASMYAGLDCRFCPPWWSSSQHFISMVEFCFEWTIEYWINNIYYWNFKFYNMNINTVNGAVFCSLYLKLNAQLRQVLTPDYNQAMSYVPSLVDSFSGTRVPQSFHFMAYHEYHSLESFACNFQSRDFHLVVPVYCCIHRITPGGATVSLATPRDAKKFDKFWGRSYSYRVTGRLATVVSLLLNLWSYLEPSQRVNTNSAKPCWTHMSISALRPHPTWLSWSSQPTELPLLQFTLLKGILSRAIYTQTIIM